MSDDELIDGIARRYCWWSLGLIAGMVLLPLLLLGGSPYWNRQLLLDFAVSSVFSLMAMGAYQAAWRSLAKTSPRALSKFYLTAPMLRMMAAVVVTLVFYAVHRGDTSVDGLPVARNVMVVFLAVFFSFYIALMIFESVYFSQVEKHNKIQ